MPSVRLQHVSFSFTDAVELFEGLDLQLDAGWAGVVGPNGAGKTTLLGLLEGRLLPTRGVVKREPDDARIAFCRQTVEELDDAIRALAERFDKPAYALRGRLGLEPEALQRWPTLSSGERKRWQVGAALALEPDVLLLDEPTNHLDAGARELLLAALQRFRGVGVVVSHDRALLDALTSATVRVLPGDVSRWPLPYSAARAEWEQQDGHRQAAREQNKARVERAQAELARKREQERSATRQRSTGARMKNKYDSDARTLGAAFHAEHAQKRIGKEVSTAHTRLEQATAALEPFAPEAAVGRALFVGYEPARTPRVFTLERFVWPHHAGREPVSLVVRRDEHVRIAGPNGAGKTTLLRALLASTPLQPDELLWLPQELDMAAAAQTLAEVKALPAEARGRTLSLVAALGVDPERLLATEAPSPGEARKLLLALGLGRHVKAAVLDEPTNHLDLPAVEQLEKALAAFPGALVLVSHDDAFAEACTGEAVMLPTPQGGEGISL